MVRHDQQWQQRAHERAERGSGSFVVNTRAAPAGIRFAPIEIRLKVRMKLSEVMI
jgi:hypothetical protein